MFGYGDFASFQVKFHELFDLLDTQSISRVLCYHFWHYLINLISIKVIQLLQYFLKLLELYAFFVWVVHSWNASQESTFEKIHSHHKNDSFLAKTDSFGLKSFFIANQYVGFRGQVQMFYGFVVLDDMKIVFKWIILHLKQIF